MPTTQSSSERGIMPTTVTAETKAAIESAADAVTPEWLATEFRGQYVKSLTAAVGYGLTLDQATEVVRPVLSAGRTEGGISGIQLGRHQAALELTAIIIATGDDD